MAFLNKDGKRISYECGDLIEELREDIAEFGGDLILEVVKEEREGVVLYKDYNFIDNDIKTAFKLQPGESVQRMTATALLELYKLENSIF